MAKPLRLPGIEEQRVLDELEVQLLLDGQQQDRWNQLTSKMHLGEADLLDSEEMGTVFGQATYEIVGFALAQLGSRSFSILLAASRNTFR